MEKCVGCFLNRLKQKHDFYCVSLFAFITSQELLSTRTSTLTLLLSLFMSINDDQISETLIIAELYSNGIVGWHFMSLSCLRTVFNLATNWSLAIDICICLKYKKLQSLLAKSLHRLK